METFERSFSSAPLEEKGELVGRVFKFDSVDRISGLDETITSDCKVEFAENAMLLLSHKRDKMLGRYGANLELFQREDGIYFKCKKVGTRIYEEALNLVKNKIIGGVSPKFEAIPFYETGKRIFKDSIKIKEVSLCGSPAYSDSYVFAREKEEKKIYLPVECY